MRPERAKSAERPLTSIAGRLGLTRRQFMQMAAAALAWCAAPGRLSGVAHAAAPTDPASVQTLEAFADTLIPGAKRTPDDRAIAGASVSPGAVEAGALTVMYLPAAGLEQFLSIVVGVLNAGATTLAAAEGIVLDPTVPPFVALDIQHRTDVLVQALETPGLVQPILTGVAALPFIAFYTAGHLPTPEAVAAGHPGLAAIGFPQPDPDGLWRFPEFSYRRRLARRYPGTRKGSPP